MKKKEYSLAVGVNKLREVKKNKGGIITHCTTKRWEDLFKKRVNKVRLFDTVFGDDCVCVIVNMEKIRQLDQSVIRIELTV